MKIVYASDLHIEINGWDKTLSASRGWEPGDVLLLAGDTVAAPYLKPHRTDNRARKIQAATRRCMNQLSKLYQKILMIGGNHEHYGMVYDETYPTMKEFLKEWPNVTYLENEVFELHGVRFICATLWTHMKKRDPLVMETVRRGMNDYHYIYENNPAYKDKPISPDFTVDKHYESWNFIKSAAMGNDPKDASLARFVNNNNPDPTIVMTHHLPTAVGMHPHFRSQGGNLLNYAYFSDLDYHIPETVGAWLHGHTHYTYAEKLDNTWMVANQLGYYMEGHSYYSFVADRWLTVRDDGKIIPEQRGT